MLDWVTNTPLIIAFKIRSKKYSRNFSSYIIASYIIPYFPGLKLYALNYFQLTYDLIGCLTRLSDIVSFMGSSPNFASNINPSRPVHFRKSY